MITDNCIEGAIAAANYLDTLIKLADKYEIDREKYVLDQITIMTMSAMHINYKEYTFKEGE